MNRQSFIEFLISFAFQDENITSNSDSEPKRDRSRPAFNRSKSLDHEVQRKLDRQQSSDTDGTVATGGASGGGGGASKGKTVEFSNVPLR